MVASLFSLRFIERKLSHIYNGRRNRKVRDGRDTGVSGASRWERSARLPSYLSLWVRIKLPDYALVAFERHSNDSSGGGKNSSILLEDTSSP